MSHERRTRIEMTDHEDRETRVIKGVPKDVSKFVDFIGKHEEIINARESEGWTLEQAIYEYFYSEDIDSQQYKEGGEGVQEYIDGYNTTAQQLLNTLKGHAENFPLSSKERGGWLFTDTNDGTDTDYEIGRFYFNIKLDKIQDAYMHLLKKLTDGGFNAKVKIPMDMTVGDMNRSDKMVLYVNDFADSNNEEALMIAIEELVKEHPDFFDDSQVPKLSERVPGKDGDPLPGISFGQEPGGGESFGNIRSKALGDMLLKARFDNVDIGSDQFDARKIWSLTADKWGIDNEHPAFNKNSDAFPVLRSRLDE